MDIQLLSQIIIPIATSIAGWLVGRRKYKNDMLCTMQATINMLVEKNAQQLLEIIEIKGQNANLKIEMRAVLAEDEAIKREIAELKTQLSKIKSITPKKS